jgi:hypothetical protein
MVSEPDISKRDFVFGPKKTEELLSEAFSIYKYNYARFWGIAAISAALQIGMMLIIYAGIVITILLNEGDRLSASIPFFISGCALIIILLQIAYLWTYGALIRAIAWQYLKDSIRITELFRATWPVLFRAIMVSILVSICVAGLCLTIIGIPLAVYIGVNWYFALPFVFIQGTGITEALTNSRALVKDNWWRVFGVNLMFIAIAFGINSIAGLIPFIGFVISMIITMPVTALGLVLLFFDLRQRKFHYSLNDLSDELNRPIL